MQDVQVEKELINPNILYSIFIDGKEYEIEQQEPPN